VQFVEEIRKGRWRAVIYRRDDGLLEVSLEQWWDTRADGSPMEGAWCCSRSGPDSLTDTLEIARTLAKALVEERDG
jgi:hypothetical protein